MTTALFSLQLAQNFWHWQAIRYEYGAVLLGSLAFLSMVYAVKTSQKRYIALMSVMGGWAFISKIVVLPTIILCILGFYVLNSLYNTTITPLTDKEKNKA